MLRNQPGGRGRGKEQGGEPKDKMEKYDFRRNRFNYNQLQPGIATTLRAMEAGKVHFLSAI